MPIYEYQCQACGHEMEALQKISDDPLKDCPECSKPGLQKKLTAAGFLLKDGGKKSVTEKPGSGGAPGGGGCCGGCSCSH